ncbi:MAG: hypothetical protein LUI85_06555 [Bacteroides sp.]|nr:hypothetical protein [Bacteroides sp.]
METTIKSSAHIPVNFLNTLLSMSDKMKLYVIKVLTDSLLKSDIEAVDEKKHTQEMLEKHAGTWVGDETAGEIMAKIRENSSTREPLNF